MSDFQSEWQRQRGFPQPGWPPEQGAGFEQVPNPGRRGGGFGAGLKKALGPLGVVLVIALKFAGKLKFLIIPILKFFPVLLKTGGTMLLSLGFYAMSMGWRFALGFVLLLLVHETGHLVAARLMGLRVGAPVFIPFMGAFIALKEAPRNAWVEAVVGIGGPLLGTAGAVACAAVYLFTGAQIFGALAYTGFFLNLFNLIPFGFLDGGRVVTAISPWLWVVGLVLVGLLLILHPSFILFLIVLMSLPRVFTMFRRRSAAEARWFEVSTFQRLFMSALYFGLLGFLVVGMAIVHIPPPPA